MLTARDLAIKLYTRPLAQAIIRKGVGLSGRDLRASNRYLSEPGVRGLHIGAGGNIREGWLNTNWYPIRPWGARAIFMDATAQFPLPDNAFDYIFTEHMIEHVPYAGGLSMLRESFRVLKPGGKLRISTPDMAFLMDLLAPSLTPLQEAYVGWASENFLRNGEPPTALSVVNNFVRDWGHAYIYDRATIESALAQVGFVDITPFQVNESDDTELRGIDHPDRFPGDYLQLESMIYQATKPS